MSNCFDTRIVHNTKTIAYLTTLRRPCPLPSPSRVVATQSDITEKVRSRKGSDTPIVLQVGELLLRCGILNKNAEAKPN